ncbi:MAG: carbohydrate binding family 9 domain-containing protein [bacterium]|nr:carbohydrate binding family 9 domain-containing protein [bacterium]
MKTALILITLYLLVTTQVVGSTGKTLAAVKITTETITVDGKPDEAAWQKARVTTGFLQNQPQKGAPATYPTEVRVLYGSKTIYFAITCHDPQPQKIVSRVRKREGDLTGDDSIAITLDTFKDGQTAYIFFTNVAGIQKDGRLADNGRTFDDTWDGKWHSAGSQNLKGWTAEIAVPFETLKYKPGKNKTWGLGVTRFVPRKMETDTWSGVMESYMRVSQLGTLTNLDLKRMKKKGQIIPHLITKLEKGEKAKIEAGLDMRYAFSQSVSADLTVNPDFAIVEADQEQINLTRFEVSLKEKRNFFLEGSEIYRQRIKLFYSRRIADIYGGLKVYGKTEAYEYSAMSVQARKISMQDEKSANFSVLRLRKNIFQSSNIGLLVANKHLEGKNYGNAGLDLVHFFSEKVNLTGQLALSYGEKNKRNIGLFLRPSYDSTTFHIHLRYTYLGENFADNANTVGIVYDDNRRELDSAVEKTWWIRKGKVERIAYGSNYNIYWGTRGGELRSWRIDQEVEVDFTNKLSFEIETTSEFKRYEKDFRNHRVQFELGYNTREWQSAELRYETGKSYDSDYHLFGGSINFKLGKHFSVEYELDRLYMKPDPEKESTWLHVLRLSHYFTRDLFIKVFFQSNSVINKENIQAVFVYRFQPPFGTLQLAYQRGTGRFGERGSQGDTVFLKFSYVL